MVQIPWLLSGPALSATGLWLMDLPRNEKISMLFLTFYLMPVSSVTVLLLLAWHPLILIGTLVMFIFFLLLGIRLRLTEERE